MCFFSPTSSNTTVTEEFFLALFGVQLSKVSATSRAKSVPVV
jgi:hypothetical protein